MAITTLSGLNPHSSQLECRLAVEEAKKQVLITYDALFYGPKNPQERNEIITAYVHCRLFNELPSPETVNQWPSFQNKTLSDSFIKRVQDPKTFLEKSKKEALTKIEELKKEILGKIIQIEASETTPEHLLKANQNFEQLATQLDHVKEFIEQAVIIWQDSPFTEVDVRSSLCAFFELQSKRKVKSTIDEGRILHERLFALTKPQVPFEKHQAAKRLILLIEKYDPAFMSSW